MQFDCAANYISVRRSFEVLCEIHACDSIWVICYRFAHKSYLKMFIHYTLIFSSSIFCTKVSVWQFSDIQLNILTLAFDVSTGVIRRIVITVVSILVNLPNKLFSRLNIVLSFEANLFSNALSFK